MRFSQKPTSEQLNKAIALLVRREHRRYFFDKLDNPAWVRPLADKRFFSDPPQPIRDDDKGTIAFPPWPESAYLARMAPLAPEDVLEVILNIPETSNARVQEDFVDAALGMPPTIAARLVKLVSKWVRTAYGHLLPEKAGRLMSQLARGGEVKTALELARSLLAVRPSTRREALRTGDDVGVRLPPEPESYFDTWEYKEIVRLHVPSLVAAAGDEALDLLSGVLDAAVRISRDEVDAAKPADHSFIWRLSVAGSVEDDHDDILNVLVSAVRDAARAIIAADSARLPAVIESLNRRGWFVFRRIALHLLTEFPDVAPDLVAAELTGHALFDELAVRHEYAGLLRKAFSALAPHLQATILAWIEQGPDPQSFRTRRESIGETPDEDEKREYAQRWRLIRLSWIDSSLPADWTRRYQELVQAFGKPEHADFPVWRGPVRTGPTSPKTGEELRAMAAIELVQLLRQWRPTEDEFMGPTREGLGRVVSSVVGSNPGPYALVASNFRGLDPTYVRALMAGLREAVQGDRTFDWSHVLSLCRSVTTAPWAIEPGDRYTMERDLDWSATKQVIAELLSAGFDKNAIPAQLRQHVLEVLVALSDDPEPTPEYEARYGGSNMDPLTLSINTARGAAMHAVVRYALWLRRNADGETGTDADTGRLLDANLMGRVQDILQRHLDTQQDPALAIRAVYGQWLPWLILLDTEWTHRNLDAIFPPEPELKSYWQAAWEAYLFYSKLYDNVFDFLSEQYRQAVDNIDAASEGTKRSHDPDGRLGEHLMVMYLRGRLTLDDPAGLVPSFFARASDKARHHALGFVGRTVQGESPLDVQVRDRLQSLWDYRLSLVKAAAASGGSLLELSAFGCWFASGKFDETWAMAQLRDILGLGVQPELGHLVAKRLASLAPSMPGAAVECLRLMADGDKDGWRSYGWRAEAMTILAAGISSTEPAIHRASRDLIDWFGSRGMHDFRQLVTE